MQNIAHVTSSHGKKRGTDLDGIVHLSALRGELILVLDEDDGSLGRVDVATALRLGGPEHSVAVLAHIHSQHRLESLPFLQNSVVLKAVPKWAHTT